MRPVSVGLKEKLARALNLLVIIFLLLHLTDDLMRNIEQKMRDQTLALLWHSERQFKIIDPY